MILSFLSKFNFFKLFRRKSDDMDIKTLERMKRQMILRGNWKEVARISKMIEFRLNKKTKKGKKSKLEKWVDYYVKS